MLGNLFMTIILHPKTSAALCGQLSFLAAVALARTIQPLLPDGKEIGLKWPNDLLIDGKKIAGILLEAEPNGLHPLEWLVVGIGVNIVDAPEGAASLSSAGIHNVVTAEDMLENLVNAIVLLYEEWRINGFAAVRAEWLAQAASLDEMITVRLPKSSSSGIFRGIDENGALLLDLPDGGRTIITSGEVFTG